MNVSIKVKQNINVEDHDNRRSKIDWSMILPDIDVACGDNMLREIILQRNPEIGIFIEIIQLYFLAYLGCVVCIQVVPLHPLSPSQSRQRNL